MSNNHVLDKVLAGTLSPPQASKAAGHEVPAWLLGHGMISTCRDRVLPAAIRYQPGGCKAAIPVHLAWRMILHMRGVPSYARGTAVSVRYCLAARHAMAAKRGLSNGWLHSTALVIQKANRGNACQH